MHMEHARAKTKTLLRNLKLGTFICLIKITPPPPLHSPNKISSTTFLVPSHYFSTVRAHLTDYAHFLPKT